MLRFKTISVRARQGLSKPNLNEGVEAVGRADTRGRDFMYKTAKEFFLAVMKLFPSVWADSVNRVPTLGQTHHNALSWHPLP